MEIAEFANYVSILSGAMTIFGISGIISWGFDNDTKSLGDKIITVFAYSIKTFFVLGWLAIVFGASFLLYFFVLLPFKGSITSSTPLLWEKGFEIGHLVSYTVALSVAVPVFFTFAACIYSWSFEPLRSLLRKFKKSS